MPIAHVNNTELYYVEHGTGRPCLVMHGGLGFDHTYLHPWLDPLGDVFHLVYYDHRCNGRSGRPPLNTFTYEQLAEDADTLRKSLGFEKVVIMGHSAGGFIALKYALHFSQKLSHLILIDTAPAMDYSEEIMTHAERKAMTSEVTKAFTGPSLSSEADYAQLMKTLAPLYYFNYNPAVDEQLFNRMIFGYEAGERDNELQVGYNVVSRLGEINVPTLILVGRDDWITPLS